jgi:putative toxin-antitoxin system antitoxin component (TIGR02293 family)
MPRTENSRAARRSKAPRPDHQSAGTLSRQEGSKTTEFLELAKQVGAANQLLNSIRLPKTAAFPAEEYVESLGRLSAAVDEARRVANMAQVVQQQHAEGLERFRNLLQNGTPAGHSYAVLLGLPKIDLTSLIHFISIGFGYSTFERLIQNTGLQAERLANMIDIPRRTLARRRREGRLTAEESDRLLRVSRLFGKALQLFEGDRDAAVDWLTREQRALGGAIPIEIAKTELGAREVENLIDRVEHGVFS